MGGSQSQEFMVYTDAGEDLIASCPVCGYAANTEKAVSRLDPVTDLEPTGDGKPELISTPGMGAIADIAAFLKMQPANDIKCVAYMADFLGSNGVARIPVISFLRGDHFLNETKLSALIQAGAINLMEPADIEKTFNAPAGFLGPIGLQPIDEANLAFLQQHGLLPKSVAGEEHKPPIEAVKTLRAYHKHPIIVIDKTLEGRKNMVAGANKLDYHYRNVTPGKDFAWTLSADIRTVNEGEGCPKTHDGVACTGKLVVGKAVEIAHIFKLGYKYTETMGARVLDVNGKEVTPIMGSYGIGIERLLTAAIEQSNDEKGFWLSASIAPFAVVVTVTDMRDGLLVETGEKLAAEFDAAHIDVLLDDRKERAGVKFKDADLIGIPYRVNVGKKTAEGKVELVTRSTGASVDVALADLLALVKERIEEDGLLGAVEE
jgi:prolyl-tRNA synthetase